MTYDISGQGIAVAGNTSGRRRRVRERLRRAKNPVLLISCLLALGLGALMWLIGAHKAADICWISGTVIAWLAATEDVVTALRKGRFGVDMIAWLALIGTVLVGEYLAGALIGVMLATGAALDAAAERRAAKDLHALLDRAPRTARRRLGESIEVVPLDAVAAGDILLVGPGEVVPVDGWLTADTAELDESALTGEPLTVTRGHGELLRSGIVNAGTAFELRARASARDSTYAGIVALAQHAASERAPMVRVADRVAAWFLPLALVVAGAAWVFSGSAVRAVGVLVVATPCPLLLAVPVAIVSGLSRASRLGVVIRDGGALENLGYATTLVMDKT
ncbi:HAD-IC family P-type ATPase, partial [Streptomyces roseolus]|uniref:HAD-IC family P-type ATPase n=1 Tax=Streptomyces roseolus TaxID=67358 RepID=UPI003660B8A5